MSVFRRNGNWWISYFDPPGGGGKRFKEKVGPNKQDAETLLGVRRKAINEGIHPELRRVKPVLFKDHAAEVLEKHYKVKRSHGWAKIVIDKHLIPHFGGMTLASVTPHAVSEYVAARLAAGAGHGTINGERAVLSKVMSLAVEWERIHDNAVKKVKKLENPAGRLRFLTQDEADKLTEKAPDHIRPVIIAALETGGRRSELLGLRWDDVDFSGGLLYFDQTNTKSARQREIPMTPTLTATLRELGKVRRINGPSREYVFTRYGKRLQDVRTAFEKAKERAKLGKDVTFHTLRHTFASWYIMRPGSSLNLLRDLLGHQDTKTTMIYAHLSPEYRKSAVPLMGRQGAVPDCPRNVPADSDQEKAQEQVV